MTAVRWLGLDPGDGGVDERHVEHRVLDLLDVLGLTADLVCTHTVDGPVRTAASARLTGRAGDVLSEVALVAALRAQWDGALVLDDGPDGAAVELGPAAFRAGARAAVWQARDGLAGRVVRFPGQDALGLDLPVGDVALVSAVEAVVPAVGDVTGDTVLRTSGYLRPRFEAGRLLLAVRPGPDGTVVPVEREHVHACAGH